MRIIILVFLFLLIENSLYSNLDTESRVSSSNKLELGTSLNVGKPLFLPIGPLSGIYTVGTTTSDFDSLAQVVTALNTYGVDSSVVFILAPRIYHEMLYLSTITGASNSNTITFKGLGAQTKIKVATNQTSSDVVRLTATKHVILDSLWIESISTNHACGIRFYNGSDSNIVRNCSVIVSQNSYMSNGIIFSGSYSGYNVAGTASYNTIENSFISGGYSGIHLKGNMSYVKGNRIIGNEIIGSLYFGIFGWYQDGLIIKSNYIHSPVGTSIDAIHIDYCRNGTKVEGNNLFFNNTNSVNGISVAYSNYQLTSAVDSCLVTNNMINITSNSGSYGIYLYNANETKFLFNSVSVNGDSNTAAFRNLGGGSAIIIENNIFASFGLGYTMALYTPSIVISCDYNNYYSTGSQFAIWGTNVNNLSSLQTANGKDIHSISVSPQFVSSLNLHSQSPALKVGLYKTEVITDFDEEQRDSIPCIGADEFTINYSDAGVSSLVQNNHIIPNDTTDVKIVITNYGADTIFNVIVNWALGGVVQQAFIYSDTLLSAQLDTLIIGTHVFNYGIPYELSFWTSNPNGGVDLDVSNDSLIVHNLRTLIPTGSYTIGNNTSYNYQSLDSLISDINIYGICGAVVFNIDSGTYSSRIVLDDVYGSSQTNTITFQSLTGDSSSVVINHISTSIEKSIVKLNNQSYVTIRGITFNVSNPFTAKGIYLTGVVSNNRIENCVFNLPQSTNMNVCGIHLETDSSYNNIFINSIYRNAYYGAFLVTTVPSKHGIRNNISNNTFEGFYDTGILSTFQDSIIYCNNIISNSTNSGYAKGIICFLTGVGFRIMGNRVLLSSQYQGIGIQLNFNGIINNQTSILANNMISIDNPNSSNSGISMINVYNANVYYNSVNIISGLNTSSGVLFNGGSGNTFKNNNIYSVGYSYNFTSGLSIFSSDYNNFKTSGPNMAYWNGPISNLSSWQSTTSMDLHSQSINPDFVSNTDLHLAFGTLQGLGTFLTEIPYDIDGDNRDTLSPDIGADEFISMEYDAGVSKIVLPSDTTPILSSNTVKIRIINYGTYPLDSISVQYMASGQSAVIETWMGSQLQQYDSVDFTFQTPYSSPIGLYQLCAKTLLPNDVDTSNNMACKSFVSTNEEVYNEFKLWQNIPNPTDKCTTIKYQIPYNGVIHFQLVNSNGHLIYDLVEKKTFGAHQINIDASKLNSGLYFYSIVYNGKRIARRMIVF